MLFLGLLKKPTPTAAELREAVATISVATLEAEVNRLEAERRRLLLDGSDDEVIAIERKIEAANREVERAAAAIEELTARIANAEARERTEHHDRLAAENIKRRHDLRRSLIAAHKAATALAAALTEFSMLDRAYHETNRALAEDGRGDLIQPSLQELILARDGESVALQFAHQVGGLLGVQLPGYYPSGFVGGGSHLARLESLTLPAVPK
jgi:hypothetical protein